MSLDSALYTKITTVATATIATRCYPAVMPERAAVPAVTFQRISTVPYHSHDGFSGLVKARYEVIAWDATNAAAKTLANLIRVGIDGGGWTAGSDTIQVCLFDGEELVSDYGETTDSPRYGVAMQFQILHNETTS